MPPDQSPEAPLESVYDAAERLSALEGADEGAEQPARDDDAPGDDGDGEETVAQRAEREAAMGTEEDPPAAEGGDPPPEFWTAEQKALWSTIPEAARKTIREQETLRIEFANTKAREAAEEGKKAKDEVARVLQERDQLANWWKANGPQFAQTFANKWAGVDWNKLSAENPAEWARLRQAYESEAGQLQEANRQHQAEVQASNQRAAQAFEQEKVAEHKKLEAKLPEYFSPEKAKQTYDELGTYLFTTYGIPADRINAIYEAPVIEIALKAMRFDQAQKAASAAQAKNPATPAPKRVVPGPATPAGNRQSDEARQARQRFKESGFNDVRSAADLIRLNGL